MSANEPHSLQTFSLRGKKAIVTGGNRGIGLAVSQAFAEAGADVAIIYQSAGNAHQVAEQLSEKSGREVKAYQCNVSDRDACASVFKAVSQDLGGLDIVVVNAGVGTAIAAEDCSPQQYRSMMDVNVGGAFYSAQAAADIFKQSSHEKGNIIFTTSVSSIMVNTPQKQAVYNSTKAAVLQLARSLAVEWASFCRVNCISPGYVATDMTNGFPESWKTAWLEQIPLRRMCQPSELKGVYVFCASDASSYMTGAHIIVDGGLTLP